MTTAERIARARVRDEGFTLIEVMVAMVVFAIVAGAAAAMLVGGTKAAMVTRMDTGAKELGQQQLEAMRNLLHQPDGGSDSSAVELLNKYFPAYASSSVACGLTGFVGASATRCASDGDPSTGAFYRTVINPVPSFTKYKQYVTIQFMNSSRSPIAVDSGYSPSSPPSGFMSIGVQTFWTVSQMTKRFYLNAFIPSASPASPLATLSAHALALSISGSLDSSRTASLGAGLVDLAGSVTLGATASASAQGGFVGISGGTRSDGSVKVSSVPPTDTSAPYSHVDTSPATLSDNGVEIGYINAPSYSGVGASTTNALPVMGSSTSPVTGYVPKQGSGQRDIRFDSSDSRPDRLELSSGPLAYVTQGATGDPVPAASSTAASASASGYATTTATSGGTRHAVSTTVSASTQTIHLLPTSFAPAGLVQIRLASSSVTCQTNGLSATTPNASYTAYVSFWQDATATNWQYNAGSWSLGAAGSSAGYSPYLTLNNAQSVDALRTMPLDQIQVGTHDGNPLFLSDYIDSWHSLTTSEAASVGDVDATTFAAQANVEGVLTVSTTPMRSDDSDSGVSMSLGTLSCTAGDSRP